jgi:hypothetical protein
VWSALAAVVSLCAAACSKKATPQLCDEVVEKYAELAVRERNPTASEAVVKEQRDFEKKALQATHGLPNCDRALDDKVYRCAKSATTADGWLRCFQ